MNTKSVYIPYVSKSDRSKGRSKELKAMGFKGDVMALQMANELLSPSGYPMPVKFKNQRQKRKLKRQIQ